VGASAYPMAVNYPPLEEEEPLGRPLALGELATELKAADADPRTGGSREEAADGDCGMPAGGGR
jgi:hypothetical protein